MQVQVAQVPVPEVVQRSNHPVVRHAVGPAAYAEAWTCGDAVVVRGARHTMVVGPPGDAGVLMRAVAAHWVPRRLSVEEHAHGHVPDAWSYDVQGHWHWMRSTTPVPVPGVEVVEVDDVAAVDAVLDEANPGSHARPGMPDIETWLGVRDDDGRLVGVGAIRRDPDGSGHLRGIAVLPGLTGRGLGTALSAGLTRRAMDRPPRVATLGVYVDNAPALHIYARLGYRTDHTFLSGQVDGASVLSSTTAAAPSR